MPPASSRIPSATPRRAWRWAIGAGCLVGAGVGALMMWIAWHHNAQGEFHEAGIIHWAAWLAVGWSSALVVAIPVAAIIYVVWRASTAMPPAEGPPRAG
jgi:hypothetical protein